MKRLIFVLPGFLIFSFSVSAAFLPTGIGARGVAMANTSSISGGDVYSIYYNPAGLYYVKNSAVSTSLSQFYLGLKDASSIGEYFIGSCFKLKNGSIGVGIKSLMAESLYKEDIYYLGWGGNIENKLGFPVAIGGTLKFFYHKYGTTPYTYNSLKNSGDTYTGITGEMDPVFEKGFSKQAVSLDFGMIVELGDNFNMGLSVKDILSPDVGIKDKDIVPVSFETGLSFMDKNRFMCNFVFHKRRDEKDLRVGLEKWINRFAVRGGVEYGSRLLLLNFGFGWLERNIFSIDYSFTMSAGISENNGTHRIAISYKFGKYVEREVQKKEKKIEIKVISKEDEIYIEKLKNKRKNELLKEYLKGVSAMKRGDYEEAMRYLQWVVIFEVEEEIKDNKDILEIKDRASRKIKELKEKIREARKGAEKLKKERMRKHFMKGQEYYLKGEYRKAIEEWEKVLEIDPEHSLSKMKIEKAKEKLRRR